VLCRLELEKMGRKVGIELRSLTLESGALSQFAKINIYNTYAAVRLLAKNIVGLLEG
jgi:hypothetical protein